MTKVITISAAQLAEKIETKLQKKPGTTIRIVRAKLQKANSLEVEYEKTITRALLDEDGKEKLVDFISEVPAEKFRHFAHPDLLLAFDLMRSHLVIIADQREAFDINGNPLGPQTLDNTEDALSKISVTGFSLTGDGVTLTGYKKIRGSKVFNLNPPYQEFEDTGEEPYPYTEELQHVIEHATEEVEAYINGKMAPDAQTKMDFDATANDDEPE